MSELTPEFLAAADIEAATPITVGAVNHVIDKFQHMVAGLLDNNGVYPHVLVFEKSDGVTNIEFIDQREPGMALAHSLNRLIEERPKYLVFGVDRFSLPDQGVNTKDFVSVYFWDDDAWRFGIIEYEHEKVVGLRWDCEFWKGQMEKEIKMAMARLLKVAA